MFSHWKLLTSQNILISKEILTSKRILITRKIFTSQRAKTEPRLAGGQAADKLDLRQKL